MPIQNLNLLNSMMTPPPMDDSARKRSDSDFVFGKVIGEGSFSTVYLAKDIHTSKEFAIKVLEKRHIIREKKMEYVLREKKVLQILSLCTSHFVRLYCTFQDAERLYFVLTYAKNGELLPHIKNAGFNIECTKYYTAELVLALEMLNSKGIVHRDLKPENILFDENWHILITDFGSAKILSSNQDRNEEENNRRRKNSFVGTAQYVSPELLKDSEAVYASDLWALGCIIFQMVTGLPPFRAGSEYLIFQKILKLEYEFPEGFDQTAKNLVEKLLIINPSKRLGACDTEPYISIRQHEFFSDIDWDNIGPPPKIVSYTASSSDSMENHNDNRIPDNLEPGLDREKASRLQLNMICQPSSTPIRKKSESNRNVMELEPEEVERRMELQKVDKWHGLVEGNLILKQGLVDKKKGLFARRRMLLLTRGPHLYYVDPATMVLKGEIPCSAELRTEAKNFKTFFVHTPNRTYYLEDPDGYALEWCKAIEEVRAFYYPQQSQT